MHCARCWDTASNKKDNFPGLLEQRVAGGSVPVHSSSTQISDGKPGPDITERFMTLQAAHSW